MTEAPLLCKDLQCDLYMCLLSSLVFPSGSAVKNPPANAGDAGSIPGSGRSPGEGNGNPLQYSWLENPMNRGAWRATVHGVAMSQTQLKRLNTAQGKPKCNFCWTHWSCCTKAGSPSSTENYHSLTETTWIYFCVDQGFLQVPSQTVTISECG